MMPALAKIKSYRYLIIFIAILVLFFVLRFPFIHKEYVPEETLWVHGGESFVATGFPWVYWGEQAPAHFFVDGKGPLIYWLLFSPYKLFGSSEAASRSIPLVLAFGQIILLYLLGQRIFGGELGKKIGLLAAFLITINPFALQNSIQLDLDGGIVGFFALLVIFLAWPFVTGDEWPGIRKKIALFLASTAIFWARFDTPLMVFFSLALCAFIFGGWKRALRLTKMFFLSSLAAMGVLIAYDGAFGQLRRAFTPLLSPVKALFGAGPAAAASRISDALPNINFGALTPIVSALFPKAAFAVSSFLWITIPLFLLIFFVVGRIVWEKKLKERGLLYLLLPSAVIFLAFTLVAPGFNYPRYIQSALLLAALAISAYIVGAFENNILSSAKKWCLVFLSIVMATAIVFLRAPLSSLLFENRIRTSPILAGIGFLASIAFAVFLLAVMRREKYIAFTLWGLLAVYTGFCAVIISHDIQKPYSLSAYYGNYGFKAAGKFLNNTAGPADVVVAVDPVGYYYGGKYYDATTFVGGDMPNIKPTIVAVYDVPPHRFDDLTAGKKLIATFGTVEVYSD